jgi:protein-tyrosine phosphatase
MSAHPPSRVIPLLGATNFRDLGGYAGAGGKRVKWRRLFRSDHLAALQSPDHVTVSQLGISRAFDFRGVSERAQTPYEVPGVKQVSLAIEPAVVQRMQDVAAAGKALTGPVVTELMKDLYRGLVSQPANPFARLFEHLLEVDEPAVFHCTAGKDRTGLAAALILEALGVSRSDILQDYLLTNQLYRHPIPENSKTPAEALAVLWTVQTGFLEAAWDSIDRLHGGLDAYLRDRLRVSDKARDVLRHRYLEQA